MVLFWSAKSPWGYNKPTPPQKPSAPPPPAPQPEPAPPIGTPPPEREPPGPEWKSVPVTLWTRKRIEEFQAAAPDDWAMPGQLAYFWPSDQKAVFAIDWWPIAHRDTGRYFLNEVLLAARNADPVMYRLMLHEFCWHGVLKNLDHPVDGELPWLGSRYFEHMAKATGEECEAAHAAVLRIWGAVDVTRSDEAGPRAP